MTFAVGDKVVYPHHGAAVIEGKEKRVFDGQKTDYFVLRITYGDLKVSIPVDKADEIGLREVINDEEVEEVFAVLRKKEARMPTNWSRRFKNHVEKLKSGDIYQVAEVVRNLSIREADKGLSAGEKRMLARARQILVSELTFALNVDEEAAELRLDDVLAGRDKPPAKAAKAAKPAAKATEAAAKPRRPPTAPSDTAEAGRRRRREDHQGRREEVAGQTRRWSGCPAIVVAAGSGSAVRHRQAVRGARCGRAWSTSRSTPRAARATRSSSCCPPDAQWDGAPVAATVVRRRASVPTRSGPAWRRSRPTPRSSSCTTRPGRSRRRSCSTR